jgi:hypothetical protein
MYEAAPETAFQFHLIDPVGPVTETAAVSAEGAVIAP